MWLYPKYQIHSFFILWAWLRNSAGLRCAHTFQLQRLNGLNEYAEHATHLPKRKALNIKRDYGIKCGCKRDYGIKCGCIPNIKSTPFWWAWLRNSAGLRCAHTFQLQSLNGLEQGSRRCHARLQRPANSLNSKWDYHGLDLLGASSIYPDNKTHHWPTEARPSLFVIPNWCFRREER